MDNGNDGEWIGQGKVIDQYDEIIFIGVIARPITILNITMSIR